MDLLGLYRDLPCDRNWQSRPQRRWPAWGEYRLGDCPVHQARIGFNAALSLVRSEIVIRLKQLSGSGDHVRTPFVLAVMYSLTTAAMFGAAWIGIGLAHGRY